MKWWPFKTASEELDEKIVRRNNDLSRLDLYLPDSKLEKYQNINGSSLSKTDSLLRMLLILEAKVEMLENDLRQTK